MNRRIRLYGAVTLLALFMAGCSGPCDRMKPISAPALRSGSADFTTYVAMGTSIGAGYESGGLVDRHQVHSYPALFARQVGAPFTLPTIGDPGIQPLLQLVSLSPLVITRPAVPPGSPTNALQPLPYHNLCVPGALLYDADSTTYYGLNPFFSIITRGQGSVLQQAVVRQPTFVSLEYGANEVLGPATNGSGTPLFDVPTFTAILGYTLADLHNLLPNAKLALFTVPDVTAIPFVTTIPPVVINPATGQPVLVGGNPVPLIGPDGPLSLNDRVLLTALASLAVGTGIPVALGGNGQPLPDAQVLSAGEITTLRAAVDGYNAAIVAAATARGAALVDLHGLLQQAATPGLTWNGTVFTSAFVTGGLFSLDGIHPTDLAHGFIANLMIDAVNAKFGAAVPRVNLADAATATASSLRQARSEGAPALPRVEGLEATLRMFPGRR